MKKWNERPVDAAAAAGNRKRGRTPRLDVATGPADRPLSATEPACCRALRHPGAGGQLRCGISIALRPCIPRSSSTPPNRWPPSLQARSMTGIVYLNWLSADDDSAGRLDRILLSVVIGIPVEWIDVIRTVIEVSFKNIRIIDVRPVNIRGTPIDTRATGDVLGRYPPIKTVGGHSTPSWHAAGDGDGCAGRQRGHGRIPCARASAQLDRAGRKGSFG